MNNLKTIRFFRLVKDDNIHSLNTIFVDYKCSLKDPNNVDENFKISDPINLSSYLETKLFHFLDRKFWTLNELIFFAKNNQICLIVLDENNRELKRYGECTNVCGGFKINDLCFIANDRFLKINS